MLHELDELGSVAVMEPETTARDAGVDAATARLKTAFDHLERQIDANNKALSNLPTLKVELQKFRDENAKLKAERDELKKAAIALTQKNEKLGQEIKHVSERLDMAIDKIGRVLEA